MTRTPNNHWTHAQQFYQGRSVLITGHTGFIGSWLTEMLTQMGATVDGLSVDEPHSLLQGNRRIREQWMVDIRDRQALQEICQQHHWQLVIHLAAQSLLPVAQSTPAETFEVNVLGTLNLITALQIHPPELLLLASSDKCYKPSSTAHQEEDPLQGLEPYGASKAAMDIAVLGLSLPYPCALLRPGNAIGAGDCSPNRLLPDTMRALHKQHLLQLRTPDSARPWQHVIELCWAFALLGAETFKGTEAWNIGPKQSVTVRQMVHEAQRHWQDATAMSNVGPAHYPDDPKLALDCRKLKNTLGWQPELPMSTRVQWTVEGQQALLRGEPPGTLIKQQLRQFRQWMEQQ